MKRALYHFLTTRRPQAGQRYQALRQRGVPRWKAAPALLAGAFAQGGNTPLPAQGSESAQTQREDPRLLAHRLAQFDLVSFDVFDTLLLREVDDPQTAFSLVGAKLSYPDFRRLRVEAELLAREKNRRAGGRGEVTLREIWQELALLTALPVEEGMAVELEVEAALCRGNPYFVPVVESLRQRGKPMALVSDMYLPAEFLQDLLRREGFGRFPACLVSGEEGCSKGDGALFRRLRQRFPQAQSLAHVGDNPHSDGAMAGAQGIEPVFYQSVTASGSPYRAADLSPVVGSVYRGMVNGKLHSGAHTWPRLYEYGFVYGGLFALGYCRFLRQWADQAGADRLLFLSRDGEALLTLYHRLYPQDPRPVYAYWSRLAAAKVCAGLFPADYFRRFLIHKVGKSLPLQQVLASMELSSLLPGLCGALGLSPQTALTHKNAREVQHYLQGVWDKVLAVYQPQRQAAGEYYRQLLSGCSHAGVVDIGWAGSGPVSLSHAARRLWNIPCKITGLVAGTNSAHSPERDAADPLLLTGELASYLFSPAENRDLWKLHHPGEGHNLFWELLLGGIEGSLRGIYPAQEGGWRMEFSLNPHAAQVEEIHRGLWDFAQEWVGLEQRLGLCLPISGRDAYGPMLEVFGGENAPYRRGLEGLFDEPGIG